jgi:RNA polymerase sigma factor (sigma-70 family)
MDSAIVHFLRAADRRGQLDAAHDALVGLLASHETVHLPGLVTRTKYRHVDLYRRRRRVVGLEVDIIDDNPGPDRAAQEHDEIAAVRFAIDRLPEPYREAIRRHYILEQTPATIANEIGCPRECERLDCGWKIWFTKGGFAFGG